MNRICGGGNLAPSLTTLDVNHDGLLDVVMGDNEGRVWILRNTGNAAAPAFALEPLKFSRTNAAYLEIIDSHNVRIYFALPILPGLTSLVLLPRICRLVRFARAPAVAAGAPG